ncbi:MAG TPA: hypothetical protein VFJ61_11100 [Solirubrobacterales bacterium]|nr:hypothetical protein [Solirubrobacterales bacterium]
MSRPLVALLEALLFEPAFFAPFLDDDLGRAFDAVFLAAFEVFDAAFLVLAFAFDPDFAALRLELDDFDFEPALAFGLLLDLLLLELPAAFLSAI